VVHNSVNQEAIKLLNSEIEIEEGSRVEDLINYIGIQHREDVMFVANQTILPCDSSLNNINEIKIYPVIIGG
jgi:sulfur carrier protein ThiS